jgi:hypothetical protein
MSRHGLERESRSRHYRKGCLDPQKILGIFKKFVPTYREIFISIRLDCFHYSIYLT